MDQVSRFLMERERALPSYLPYIVLACALHGSIVATIFFAANAGSSRPAQLPAVSVKLIRPTQPPARQPEAPPAQAQAEAPPRPTAAPQPTVKPAEPEPDPPAPASSSASSDAMPAAASTAAPTPAPAVPAPSAGRAASGLSIGGGDGADSGGIPADFQFTYYVTRMLALIESNWYKPPVPAGTSARVRFQITKSGRLREIQLEESSGIPSFDRAVLRAMYAANPLPPLPPAYFKPSLTVHLSFTE